MLGGKGSYSRSLHILWRIARKNDDLRKKLLAAKRRYRLHQSMMRPVNMDELVDKYAKGATPYIEKYKIKYHREGSPYVVIADPAGYLRVLDLRVRRYVDVYTGETLKGDEPDYQNRTHFRILRRDELNGKN